MRALIPTVERANGYRDLTVLLASLRAYAPSLAVTVGFYGWYAPPASLGVTVLRRPPDAKRCSAGFGWLLQQTRALGDEIVLLLNDDLVFTPWTLETLEADLVALPATWGLCGLRSNIVAGVGNIRRPASAEDRITCLKWASESEVLEAPWVPLVALAARRTALETSARDWEQVDWFGDNLLSYDVRQAGFGLYVSRAYVHHHGSRTTTPAQYAGAEAEGATWLRTHRPDAAAWILGDGGRVQVWHPEAGGMHGAGHGP